MCDRTNNVSFALVLKRYSLLFLIYSSVCIVSFFVLFHKSFITFDDGLSQQYVYFVYVGIWIRRLLENIFVKHLFELPMWDMSIGIGSDSLLTLSGVTNVLADPFYWISALLPIRIAEVAFNIIVLVKLYLSGVAFTVLCHEKSHDISATVTGAMIYTFSATISVGFRQAFFLNVFILFPLLILGCDRLWNGKGHRFYVCVLAISVIYSFYFTYMFGLLVIVYCVIRFLSEKEDRSFKKFRMLLRRFILFTLFGIGIGIGPIIPSLINMSKLDRVSGGMSLSVIDLSLIRDQFLYAFSYCNLWHESIWGFSSIALIAVILLFKNRGSNSRLKIMLIIYTVSLAIPLIGSVMNGFNYPANRYIFGYAFLLAYIVTMMYGSLTEFRGKLFFMTAAISVLYLVITTLFSGKCATLSGVSLLISVFIIGTSNHLINSKKIRSYMIMLSVLISCFIIGVARNEAFMSQFIDFGSANDSVCRFEDELDSFDVTMTRYDLIPYSYTDVAVNSSMLMGVNGCDFYHSNYNNNIDHYYDDLAVVSNAMGFQQTGLRGRNLLELQNGTEYIFRQNTEDRTIRAPYSYELIDESDDYDVYRTSRGASMVYFYDEAVSYDDYMSCDPIEREELTTRYCVIDGAASVRPGSTDDHNELNYDICTSGDLSFDNGSVNVTSDSGYIELDIPDTENKEINVLVSGLNHEGDYYYQFAVVLMDGDKAIAADFFAGIDKGFAYYHGKEDLLFSFGCIREKIDSIRLYFNTPGEYSLGDVSVYTRDIDQLDKLTNDFYEHADLDDVSYEISGNHININAVADRDKYLYIAVPYSEGWTAAIDGEKAEIMRANEAFIVLKVPAGSHEVQLNYKTPYLAAGFSISMITTAGFIVFEIMKKRFR